MRSGRLWMVVALVAVVASILLGWRFRVMFAGGRAMAELAVVGLVVWLLLWKGAGAPSRDGPPH